MQNKSERETLLEQILLPHFTKTYIKTTDIRPGELFIVTSRMKDHNYPLNSIMVFNSKVNAENTNLGTILNSNFVPISLLSYIIGVDCSIRHSSWCNYLPIEAARFLNVIDKQYFVSKLVELVNKTYIKELQEITSFLAINPSSNILTPKEIYYKCNYAE